MEIMVEFILWEDELPIDEVLGKIGLPCSEKFIKDEIRMIGADRNIEKVNETSSITYDTGYIKTNDVKEPLEMMYNMLYERQNLIAELIERYSLNSYFCIVMNLTDNPIVEIPNKFINLAAKLKAYIEFDTYIN